MWRQVLCYQSTWRQFTGVWRHVFYNTTACRHSQTTCDVVYSTDMTSHHRICDVMRSNSTTWRHFLEDVTPCILPDMTLHHGTCDMCILRPTWRHLTVDMLRRVFYHTWRHSYDSMWRHVFYARLHDVTSQRTWRHVWQDSAVHSQRLFNVRSQF
jgi:hypothetical protein